MQFDWITLCESNAEMDTTHGALPATHCFPVRVVFTFGGLLR
jgi:hypothetical protein